MTPDPGIDRLTGWLLLAVLLSVIAVEWGGLAFFGHAAALCVLTLLALITGFVAWPRRIFVVVGVALFLIALATRPDWEPITEAGLRSAAFIAAFLAALTSLRSASASSERIAACGRFLADQPPGKRYLALTIGGHLFGMMLSYGAITLLGDLAANSARREPDPEVRAHRIRRMLLAIQRGFASTLPWSPLAFCMAITTALVPGASWGAAVGPCLVSAFILAGLGWALDTIFKPRLGRPPARRETQGSWLSLWPLIGLLALLMFTVGGLHVATGLRAVAVALPVVPLIAFGWVALQNRGHRPGAAVLRQATDYFSRELPSFRSELLLLMMAGFIGTLGGRLLAPHVAALGVDLSALPPWILLPALVFAIPATGQIGMNPILTVTLFAPLLPDPAASQMSPTALVIAISAGWALSGASSPYTATTLMVGRIGGVGARHVGLAWNGLYTLLAGLLLSVWAVLWAGL